jgi:acetyltransferase-like isoleucine patch superfamily enzyme
MRKFILVLAIFLPQILKKIVYSRIMGWQIESGVRIGFSFIDAEKVSMGKNVNIGHFNIIKSLRRFEVGENSCVVNFNHFFGATYAGWPAALRIGSNVYFMSHHFIDVGGTVSIGDSVIFGGRSTQVWGHSLVYNSGQPQLKPLDVGM